MEGAVVKPTREETTTGPREVLSALAPLLIAVAVGMALLLVFQAGDTLHKDPLHTDLQASPFYARSGFEPVWAQIDDPRALDWDLTIPPHGGKVILSDLPGQSPAGYGMFSTAHRSIREFTLLIPFSLSKEALRNTGEGGTGYPMLSLAGIGENWEIFVNGHSVARQIFLDKSGRIAEFRNLHDVSIPVAKDYLRAGKNALVIHILGAPGSKWTGLRYASPYYLTSSSNTFSDLPTLSGLLISISFLLVGLYHLLVYVLRRADFYSLFFVVFSVVASLYYLVETPILYLFIHDTAVLQRLDYGLMYLLIFSGVAFLETILAGKISKITTGYGIFSALLAVAQWFFPIWFAYGLVTVWRYTTIVFLAYAVIFGVARLILRSASNLTDGGQARPGLGTRLLNYLLSTEAGIVYVMLIFVGLTAIIDIIDIAVRNVNFPLKDYALLGFTLSMAFILSRKYARPAPTPALADAGLTPREMEAAQLLIEGTTRRNVARKLSLSAAELDQCERDIRQKLGLPTDVDPVLGGVIAEFSLTKRETEMLNFLREGATTDRIAAELFITEGTVRSHVSSLLAKLGVEKRQDVAAWFQARAQ